MRIVEKDGLGDFRIPFVTDSVAAFFRRSGRQLQRFVVQQRGQQRQLLVFYGEQQQQRVEPQPELQQREREQEQQQQEQRLFGPLSPRWMCKTVETCHGASLLYFMFYLYTEAIISRTKCICQAICFIAEDSLS